MELRKVPLQQNQKSPPNSFFEARVKQVLVASSGNFPDKSPSFLTKKKNPLNHLSNSSCLMFWPRLERARLHVPQFSLWRVASRSGEGFDSRHRQRGPRFPSLCSYSMIERPGKKCDAPDPTTYWPGQPCCRSKHGNGRPVAHRHIGRHWNLGFTLRDWPVP